MPRFRNDRLVKPERSHGDVSLVVQADTADAANHALRQVLRRTRGELALRWMREGFNTLDQATVTGTAPARNLMGFKDGTANPATGRPGGDGRPRVDPARRRPAGVGDGRDVPGHPGHPHAGRVLGPHPPQRAGAPDRSPPRQRGAARQRARRRTSRRSTTTCRRTSPGPTRARRAARSNLMLRRPFSYVGGVDENSQLDQGLLFTCYQRSLADGLHDRPEPPRRRGPGGVHPPARRRGLRRARPVPGAAATATSGRRCSKGDDPGPGRERCAIVTR